MGLTFFSEGTWGAETGFYLEITSFKLCFTKMAPVQIQVNRFKGAILKEKISSKMV